MAASSRLALAADARRAGSAAMSGTLEIIAPYDLLPARHQAAGTWQEYDTEESQNS
jgi:hypothetical protein